MLLQRDGSERMAVCTVEARRGKGEVLEGHDRDVVGACWPAVLKAASAAFAAGVRDSISIFHSSSWGRFFVLYFTKTDRCSRRVMRYLA